MIRCLLWCGSFRSFPASAYPPDHIGRIAETLVFFFRRIKCVIRIIGRTFPSQDQGRVRTLYSGSGRSSMFPPTHTAGCHVFAVGCRWARPVVETFKRYGCGRSTAPNDRSRNRREVNSKRFAERAGQCERSGIAQKPLPARQHQPGSRGRGRR